MTYLFKKYICLINTCFYINVLFLSLAVMTIKLFKNQSTYKNLSSSTFVVSAK